MDNSFNSRERFLRACRRRPVDRPPVWIMRQAGRYLPEYRALKEKHGFLEMVKTPELAVRVTLQPLERFGMDAAILFSDILVIPEALGQPYHFLDQGGIRMEFAVTSPAQVDRLDTGAVSSRLDYVMQAIRILKRELDGQRALLGFGGSPWTLATYMVEGGSSRSFAVIKALKAEDPDLFERLLSRITEALITYFQAQVQAGVDAIQIFDSWAGVLSHTTFWEASGKYLARIVQALAGQVPVIVFARGAHPWSSDLKRVGADVYGLDWTVSLARFFDDLGGTAAVQGNLDPALLNTRPEIVRRETLRILREFGSRSGHIFNLGHGILPEARIECLETLITTVREFDPATEATL